MKKFLLIFPLLLSLAFGQNSYSINPNTAATDPFAGHIVLKTTPVSNIKYPKIIANYNLPKYVFAGNMVRFTNSDSVILFIRAGTTHLQDGVPVYNIYTISNDVWSGYTVVRTDTADNRDTWATAFQNLDSLVVWSEYSVGANDSYSQNYQIRYGRNLGHTDTINLRWPVGWPHLQYAFTYGAAAHSDSAGYYLQPIVQVNIDTGDLTKYRVDLIRTHDYFRTYDFVNVATPSFYLNESSIEYFGGGKFGLLGRMEGLGNLRYYESTNYGASWTDRGNADSLYWYFAGRTMSSPYIYRYNDSMVHIFYGNRDNNFVEVSPFNKINDFFGGYHFNSPQLYYYNYSPNANSSLNYAAIMPIIGDSVYLVTWGHEDASDTAHMLYSRDNLKTDPNGLPIAPPTISTSDITSTAFRFEITGYTQSQIDNIRTFEFDISTSSNFSSYVTAKYFLPGATSSVSLHDIRMHSLWDNISALTTGTTYYLRIRACNNAGKSSYTQINVTTL